MARDRRKDEEVRISQEQARAARKDEIISHIGSLTSYQLVELARDSYAEAEMRFEGQTEWTVAAKYYARAAALAGLAKVAQKA